MKGLDLLTGRRSVRKFTDAPVTKELIEEIIDVTKYAPSWKNTQSVRYVAVTDKELKDKIASDCVMDFEFNRNIINAAPCLMVLTTVNKRSGYERDGSFSTSKGEHWQSFDAGVAAQTFCLAAYEKGLGTVILGVYDGEKVAEVLEIPEEKSVSALIPIGYPAEEPKAPKRKDVEELLSIR